MSGRIKASLISSPFNIDFLEMQFFRSNINYKKIKLEKMDEVKYPEKDSYPELPSKSRSFDIDSYRHEFNVEVKRIELLKNNPKLSQAKIIGGEKGIEARVVYFDFAWRAEIEER